MDMQQEQDGESRGQAAAAIANNHVGREEAYRHENRGEAEVDAADAVGANNGEDNGGHGLVVVSDGNDSTECKVKNMSNRQFIESSLFKSTMMRYKEYTRRVDRRRQRLQHEDPLSASNQNAKLPRNCQEQRSRSCRNRRHFYADVIDRYQDSVRSLARRKSPEDSESSSMGSQGNANAKRPERKSVQKLSAAVEDSKKKTERREKKRKSKKQDRDPSKKTKGDSKTNSGKIEILSANGKVDSLDRSQGDARVPKYENNSKSSNDADVSSSETNSSREAGSSEDATSAKKGRQQDTTSSQQQHLLHHTGNAFPTSLQYSAQEAQNQDDQMSDESTTNVGTNCKSSPDVHQKGTVQDDSGSGGDSSFSCSDATSTIRNNPGILKNAKSGVKDGRDRLIQSALLKRKLED